MPRNSRNVLCLHLAPLVGRNAAHLPVQQLAGVRPVRYHVREVAALDDVVNPDLVARPSQYEELTPNLTYNG
jgi:hypothetical protein